MQPKPMCKTGYKCSTNFMIIIYSFQMEAQAVRFYRCNNRLTLAHVLAHRCCTAWTRMVVVDCCSFHIPCIQGVSLSIWGMSGNRHTCALFRTPVILYGRPNSICRGYQENLVPGGFGTAQIWSLANLVPSVLENLVPNPCARHGSPPFTGSPHRGTLRNATERYINEAWRIWYRALG